VILTLIFLLISEQGEAKSAELVGHAIANNLASVALRPREIAHTIASLNNKVFLDLNHLLLGLQLLNIAGKDKK
jgi:prohibitin 2